MEPSHEQEPIQTSGEILGQEALARLDKALEEASDSLAAVAEKVGQGYVTQDELMLRLHQFAAKLGQPLFTGV